MVDDLINLFFNTPNSIIAAAVSSVATAILTLLSFWAALSPPIAASARRAVAGTFVVVGAIGVAASIYGTQQANAELQKAMEGSRKAGQEYLEGMDNKLTTKCVPREEVQRLLIVMEIRSRYLARHRNYSQLWPPESDINKELKRRGASWCVVVEEDRLRTTSASCGVSNSHAPSLQEKPIANPHSSNQL